MFNFRRNCGCNNSGRGDCGGDRDGCGGGGHNPCNPNPQNQEFSRVVATWQTVRHYKVHSHDTMEPICGDLGNTNFESAFGGNSCGGGNHGGCGSSRMDAEG